jgi:hypothetical protein
LQWRRVGIWALGGAIRDELAAHDAIAVVFERMFRRSWALD